MNATAAHATNNDGNHIFRESQCLAIAEDPGLTRWKKLPRPVIAASPPGLQVSGFRDPSPWKKGDWWYAAIGSGVLGEGGRVLLYRSRDLRNWQYLHFVAGGAGSGARSLNPVSNGEMWECPDLFPLGGKHVLLYSSMWQVHWQVGSLDECAMRFYPEKRGVLDYGAYYAAKTQTDKHGQRIVWGWLPEQRSQSEYRAAGWACMMSLPRRLRLRPDGALGIEVDESMRQLRRNERRLEPARDWQSQLRQLRIPEATGELMGSFVRGRRPFQITLQSDLPLHTGTTSLLTVAYDPARSGQLMVDGAALTVAGPESRQLDLHIFVDGSVLELIVQGAAAYTKRFYYAGRRAPAISVIVDGPEDTVKALRVWRLAPISPDRLTS